ncbi:FtsK/SpoIIIE family DNA translocase [Yeguia hominis]|uniref:DNA translocase FtsK n=1 Tax=Yeguia hominis TaxID=2763662 RepID=A0A926DA00_9FIRM|nr:DNA translocase FtsK [Yeguia hominis]MBC8533534.1 DNA translocase FtsK [Yeguia hominis]
MAEKKKSAAGKKTAEKKKSAPRKNASAKQRKRQPAAETRKTAAKNQAVREKPQRTPEQIRQREQRMAIVLFACALLTGFLVFVEGESVWRFLHNLILGLFGACAILWPIFLLYIAVVTTLERRGSRLRTKMWLTVAVILMFCSALYIFRSGQMPQNVSYWEMLGLLYQKGVDHESVGLVSGIIGFHMVAAFGDIGSKIVVVLLLFVAVMFLTGTSLIQLFRTVTKPVNKVAENITTTVRHHNRSRDPLASDIDIPLGPDPETDSEPPRTAEALLRPARNEKLERLQKVFGIPDPEFEEEPEPEEPLAAMPKPAAPPPIVSDTTVEDIQAALHGRAAGKKQPEHSVKPEPPPKAVMLSKPELPPKKDIPEPPVSVPVQTTIFPDHPPQDGQYHFPPLSMLEVSKKQDAALETEELQTNAKLLVDTLKSFGVQTKILDICRGPSVTRYELQPAAGVKISKITNLADDLAMNLAASGIRIEAPIPGKAAVGIEVPNKHRSVVRMRDLIVSNSFASAKSRLTVVLGRDIAGQVVVADLAKMPHLLIAGTTGSGKSVCVNSFIISILYKATPDEVKFVMIDPKMVELPVYNGIPHLLIPVVTDPRKAAGALNWAVGEMMKRYQLFAQNNVRDLTGYNKLAATGQIHDENGNPAEKMTQIVIIIDELADLMMVAPNEVEDAICRLAQLARAAGIHLVVATQRPSVDVITGLIKANIPSRIALTVASPVDSRTILDVGGAEKLLGYGDMLFAPVGSMKPLRVQGCFVSDEERESVINFIKEVQTHEYDETIMEEIEKGAVADPEQSASDGEDSFEDPMMPEAIKCVVEAGQASTSLLQRRLRLGYARAGRLIDQMEQVGIVGPHEGSKPRQVLITYQQWLEMNMQKADQSE